MYVSRRASTDRCTSSAAEPPSSGFWMAHTGPPPWDLYPYLPWDRKSKLCKTWDSLDQLCEFAPALHRPACHQPVTIVCSMSACKLFPKSSSINLQSFSPFFSTPLCCLSLAAPRASNMVGKKVIAQEPPWLPKVRNIFLKHIRRTTSPSRPEMEREEFQEALSELAKALGVTQQALRTAVGEQAQLFHWEHFLKCAEQLRRTQPKQAQVRPSVSVEEQRRMLATTQRGQQRGQERQPPAQQRGRAGPPQGDTQSVEQAFLKVASGMPPLMDAAACGDALRCVGLDASTPFGRALLSRYTDDMGYYKTTPVKGKGTLDLADFRALVAEFRAEARSAGGEGLQKRGAEPASRTATPVSGMVYGDVASDDHAQRLFSKYGAGERMDATQLLQALQEVERDRTFHFEFDSFVDRQLQASALLSRFDLPLRMSVGDKQRKGWLKLSEARARLASSNSLFPLGSGGEAVRR